MKRSLIIFAAMGLAATGFAQTKPVPPMFKTQVDSVSYAFGANIAEDLKNRGVKSLNYTLLAKAMNDVFGNSALVVDQEKCLSLIQNFLTELDKQKFETNIAAEKSFLAENKKKPGITELPSGLQYEVITAGTGAKPKATDKVTVHYRGTLVNGQQFDSSFDRGQPISFGLNQVIQGWIEGLQLMPVGSKYRLFVPSSLGYGERGGGDAIPPHSTLIFEIELISIDSGN